MTPNMDNLYHQKIMERLNQLEQKIDINNNNRKYVIINKEFAIKSFIFFVLLYIIKYIFT
jgi:hypothetical protein